MSVLRLVQKSINVCKRLRKIVLAELPDRAFIGGVLLDGEVCLGRIGLMHRRRKRGFMSLASV